MATNTGFIPDSEFKPDSPTTPEGFIPDSQFKPDIPEDDPEAQANALSEHHKSINEQHSGQGPLAAIESVGSGILGPLAAGSQSIMRKGATALGIPEDKLHYIAPKPEDVAAREEAFPVTSAVGNIAGLVSPVGQGAVLGKVGAGIAEKVVPKVVEEGVLAGIKRSAVRVSAENALYQTGDEVTKMIQNNPGQSLGTAVSNVGLASVIGGVTGGVLGSVSPLWKASVGNRTSQFAADFKGRMQEHLTEPDRVGTFTNELNDYYKNITSHADEVYGPQGIKAQATSKLLPEELSPKIRDQVNGITKRAEETLKDMAAKQVPERYMNKFINDVNTFHKAVESEGATPKDIFNATQDFKQTLQGYSKGNYGPFAVPSYHEAYDFINSTKTIGRDIRLALEDSSVWGKAADSQKAINKSFSNYLPTLQDFEKKFTTEINGQRVIDPGKANTYFNQLGKPSAEIKQSMLKNFLDASEKYRQVISDTHSSLGNPNPVSHTSTNMLQNTLKEQSHGAKLADMVVKKSGATSGKLMGAVIGGGLGHMVPLPGSEVVGAFIGEHALGPFLGSVLPILTKPLVEKMSSGEGLKAAADYGFHVAKGNSLSDGIIKSIFKSGSKELPDHLKPNAETRKKLDTALLKIQQDPSRITTIAGPIGHYLPDHAVAIGTMASNISSFLNSLRPQSAPKAPLDPPIKISRAIQSQYDRLLDVAQQPLVVLDSIKNNTITSHDVIALQKMYPDLYEGLKQKIMNQIVQHTSKGDTIPYDTRLSLSLFMGQSLDSTMQPMAIMAAQPIPQQPPLQQQGNKLTQDAGSKMIKGSKSMQTATQASEAMHSSGAKA